MKDILSILGRHGLFFWVTTVAACSTHAPTYNAQLEQIPLPKRVKFLEAQTTDFLCQGFATKSFASNTELSVVNILVKRSVTECRSNNFTRSLSSYTEEQNLNHQKLSVILANLKPVTPFQAHVTANSLNMRKLPGGEIIAHLVSNDTLTVTANYQDWSRVIVNAKEGWVHSDFLKVQTQVPEIEQPGHTSLVTLQKVNTQNTCSSYLNHEKKNAWVSVGRKTVLQKLRGTREFAIDEAYFNCALKPIPTVCGTVVRTKLADPPVRFIFQGTQINTYVEGEDAGFSGQWNRFCKS